MTKSNGHSPWNVEQHGKKNCWKDIISDQTIFSGFNEAKFVSVWKADSLLK